ncbi:ubiquitin-conjugating enzyme E2-21 KD (nucleomorph) [Cryptomonas paramecium]|uniref:Ubiquitin-conjugating enzyme E2-21 KD n=1 Tax=Cryptomonas paramaecium TaxID=2898 RepID=F2HHU7_9CRYP|nr:ubiquitin-conjugating enzyme E2-21 KD [Cryptomonas paramecium]AEA38893.1 ubiquitin-conjugating enzyme E2-21 KD [Cryptomonas paramecium]|mmetsp:Transcript_37052/g.98557  ORF Transcript_37052/g.98557 Transcript_37052/m.98557 type:complete len:147 (-) Transcript_37052:21435-21875(-)
MSISNRLLKETKEIEKENEYNFVICSKENSLREWNCQFRGPYGTPYQEGTFDLFFEIPTSYPVNPPIVRFNKKKIFHANIHLFTGEICLDILTSRWTPAWTLLYLLKAILVLLSSPEHTSPLNCDAGNLLRINDHRGYCSLAFMYC